MVEGKLGKGLSVFVVARRGFREGSSRRSGVTLYVDAAECGVRVLHLRTSLSTGRSMNFANACSVVGGTKKHEQRSCFCTRWKVKAECSVVI